MKWQNELELAVKAAQAAGQRLSEIAQGEKSVLNAEGRDIKLQADRDAEKLIIDLIGAESRFPILAEESGEHGETASGPLWVIDPLDGTMNFARAIPFCAVSIALVEGTEPILGVIYDFNHNDLFYGIAEGEAWHRDAQGNVKKLSVSTIKDASKAILATGFPVRCDMDLGALEGFMRRIQRFKKIRMIGTAAMSLASVACGRMDAYAEDSIMLWDVAAGLALVRAAGGAIEMENSDKSKWARNIRCAADRSIWG